MRGYRFRSLTLVVLAVTSACVLARTGSPAPQPLPSPEGSWSLELDQSGGFAGVHLSLQVTSAGQLTATDLRSGRTATQSLSPDTMAELRRLMAQAAISDVPGKPSSCADCFVYNLTLKSNSGTVQMQADDSTLGNSPAQPLISYLRSLGDSTLGSQP